MSDNESSESESVVMSVGSTCLLIESLEAQVDYLTLENKDLKTKVEQLEIRIKVLQEVSDSELVNHVFKFL